ncbi:MAG: hypothetical protein IJP99_09160 [Methanobrevibacter sp.]|nr:hypothetical protein [Methanobrevibacter sp.]
MEIKNFDVITTKLNMFNFPECNENRYILIKFGSNIDILSPNGAEQKIILTYNIKSNDLPFHVMWECRITLTFDEELEKEITKEEFLTYSDVIDVIDKQIDNVSSLANVDLPLFSKQIND